MSLAVLLGTSLLASSGAVPLDVTALKEEIRTVVAPLVAERGGAIHYSFRDSKGSDVTDSIGYNDVDKKIPATTEDKLGLGSIAKPYTAVAVLRLVEAGKFTLETRLTEIVDPWLDKHYHGKSLRTFFDPQIEQVTVRDILHMASGLQDYDDDLCWKMSTGFVPMNHSISPFDFISPPLFNRTFLYKLGHGVSYASTNFGLAGMVIAASLDKPWQDILGPLPLFPESYKKTSTALFTGPDKTCSEYESVGHAYTFNLADAPGGGWPHYGPCPSNRTEFIDMFEKDCLNGWMFGNIQATARETANFFTHLLSPNSKTPLLTSKSIEQMTKFEPFTIGFMQGRLQYGLGIMRFNYTSLFEDGHTEWCVGHGGMDYGSGGNPCYLAGIDGTVSILDNYDSGCEDDSKAKSIADCEIITRIYNAFTSDESGKMRSCEKLSDEELASFTTPLRL